MFPDSGSFSVYLSKCCKFKIIMNHLQIFLLLISYLTTDSAGVRFDPGVKPHVPGQHVTAGKTSLTNITKVSLKR